MPLPEPGSPWPPPSHETALARYADYDAWYSGDPDKLGRVYQRRTPAPRNRPSQYRGGLIGRASRWFWGAPVPDGQRRTSLHIPLPADIATASADLLFARPPAFKFADTAAQARWDELDGLMSLRSRMHEAAEVQSPLGGVYMRAVADPDFMPHPIPTAVHADNAFPEFRWGQLVAVTFVRVLETDGDKRVRFLERYELDRTGTRPRVLAHHGVYVGTTDRLGRRVDLGAWEETRGLEETVLLDMPLLPVVYVPNMLPSREDRGSDLGRSDFETVTPIFDAIDETATALMRDVRLAKARAFVSRAFLQNLGHGKGAVWDPDAEIYQALDIPPTSSDAGITVHQFAIRVDEHVRVMETLARRGITTSGYAPQTLGFDPGTGAEITATEVLDRKSRSLLTREKKSGYWGDALPRFAAAVLWLDKLYFGGTVDPETAVASIEWPPGAETDPLHQAQTLAALEQAGAISTYLKVKTLHPDWDEPDIAEEVDRITAERALGPVASPDAFTGTRTDEDEDEFGQDDADAAVDQGDAEDE